MERTLDLDPWFEGCVDTGPTRGCSSPKTSNLIFPAGKTAGTYRNAAEFFGTAADWTCSTLKRGRVKPGKEAQTRRPQRYALISVLRESPAQPEPRKRPDTFELSYKPRKKNHCTPASAEQTVDSVRPDSSETPDSQDRKNRGCCRFSSSCTSAYEENKTKKKKKKKEK